jgi:hypothetical protein
MTGQGPPLGAAAFRYRPQRRHAAGSLLVTPGQPTLILGVEDREHESPRSKRHEIGEGVNVRSFELVRNDRPREQNHVGTAKSPKDVQLV